MERSDSKNEKVWLGKVGKTDPKKREDLTPKWEDLTQKVGRADPKKWKSLIQKWAGMPWKSGKEWPKKIGRSDLKKLEGLIWKTGKDSFEKWEGLFRKTGRSDSKHGISETK